MPNQSQTPPAQAPNEVTTPHTAKNFAVRIMPSERQFEATSDDTLLAAAEQAGIALPSSCRNGTCRTCISKLIAGTVAYSIEWPGVSLEEKQEGYILPCVAKATSDVVVEQAQASELWAG
jgi:ferredoxin